MFQEGLFNFPYSRVSLTLSNISVLLTNNKDLSIILKFKYKNKDI